MMYSIINFLKGKKFTLMNGIWSILSLLQKIKGKLMNFQKYWYYTNCFFHKYSKQLRELVTVCSYDDLSCKVCASKDHYNAIIVSEISTLWATIEEDVHQGFKSKSNLFCQLLKIGRIHQLAELFEWILIKYYL
jgi:hypothetical protein